MVTKPFLLALALAAAPGFPGEAFAVAETDGRIWVGTERGLFYTDTPGGQLLAAGGPELPVTAIAIGKDEIWVGTSEGLYLLRDGAWRKVPAPAHADPFVLALTPGETSGIAWASFGGHLHRWDGRALHRAFPAGAAEGRHSRLVGRGEELVTSLFARGDDLWIGTTRGAYRNEVLLFEGEIRDVAPAGRDGPVYFLDYRGRILDESGKVHLPENGALGLFTGTDGRLWAFDAEGELRGFVPGAGRLVPVAASRAVARKSGTATSVAVPIRDAVAGPDGIAAATREGLLLLPVRTAAGVSRPSDDVAARGVAWIDVPFDFAARILALFPAVPSGMERWVLFGLGVVSGLLLLWFIFLFSRGRSRGRGKRGVVTKTRRRRGARAAAEAPLPEEVAAAIEEFYDLVARLNETSVRAAAGEADEADRAEMLRLRDAFAECEERLRRFLEKHGGDPRVAARIRRVLGEGAA